MEIQIKPITIENSQDIRRLSEQLGYPLPLDEVKRNIVEVITTPEHIAFVAECNGKVTGWVHAFRSVFLESKAFIEIGGLIVDEDYRGKGIGKKLMETITDWAKEKEIFEIRVRSQVKRKEAHLFYAGIGFTEIKEQKVFQMNL